jgi:diadenosine tetraphosphate (Ap4A) HIT family hydrolase
MNKITDLQDQINNSCRFCNPQEKERILFETDNFYVMVSLGPIVDGYLLIVSKKHIGACFNIPNTLMTEFLSLKEKVKDILIKHYGFCIFYEHGKAGSSLTFENSTKHCYHAHLHCIPVAVELNKSIEQKITANTSNSFTAARDKFKNLKKYLYIEDSRINVYSVDRKIRNQFLRYELSEALGKPELGNWVENQNWESINRTIEQLRPYFK